MEFIELHGNFDEEMGKHVITNLQEACEGGVKRVCIDIASNGGYVFILEAIVEAIKDCRKKGMKVDTYNSSHAYSCGAMLLSFGDRRFMAPTANSMIHEVGLQNLGGKIGELEKVVKEVRELNDQWFTWLGKNMGMSRKKLEKFVNGEDKYLTAVESKKCKLVDRIEFLT